MTYRIGSLIALACFGSAAVAANAIDQTTGNPGAPSAFDTNYVALPSGGDQASAFVQNNGTSLQYTGVLLNVGAGVNNIFIKVQNQDGDDQFEQAGCYIGNNINGFGLGFFALDEPFNSAQMTATRSGSDVIVELTNVDQGSKADQTYVCSGAPAPEGESIGVHGFASLAQLDDFGDATGVLDTFSFSGPLSSSGNWADLEPGMTANGSTASGGSLARAIYTGDGGGGGDERTYCITFDNFCDSISVVDGVGEWDWTCDGATFAEGDQISLTQSAEAFLCTGESCPFGPGAAEDWSFVFRGGISGTFNLFNFTQGVQFQVDSPYTVFPGQSCFGLAPQRGVSTIGSRALPRADR
ncbi:MAG: hypothetical protein AAF184_13515 [Pseudomonadota bacterium]